MKKRPVFPFSAILIMPLIFALALVGCRGDFTDENGVAPQGVGPDGFTTDPVGSGI